MSVFTELFNKKKKLEKAVKDMKPSDRSVPIKKATVKTDDNITTIKKMKNPGDQNTSRKQKTMPSAPIKIAPLADQNYDPGVATSCYDNAKTMAACTAKRDKKKANK